MAILKPAVSAKDHFQGNENAPITLVEYGDYQCPHCGHAYPIVKEVQAYFGDNLKFVFRNFPLENIHPFAVPAAIAAEAAAKQNKFWEMHDMIFENQTDLHGNSFLKFAEALQLDIQQFKADTELTSVFDKVETDFESGIKSGVNGTPSFFINGVKYNGSWEKNELVRTLNNITN
jgi:protein-disulfide isomerase